MGVISQASISLHYSIPALNLKSEAHQALYKQNVLNWIWGLLTNHCAVAQKLVCFCESYLIESEESKISSHSLPFHLSFPLFLTPCPISRIISASKKSTRLKAACFLSHRPIFSGRAFMVMNWKCLTNLSRFQKSTGFSSRIEAYEYSFWQFKMSEMVANYPRELY